MSLGQRLINPDFASVLTGWTAGAGWNHDVGGGPNGIASVLSNGNGDANRYLSQRATVVAGESIECSVMVWSNTPGAAHFNLQWYDGGAWQSQVAPDQHPGDSTWRKLIVIAKAPAGADQGQITLRHNTPTAGDIRVANTFIGNTGTDIGTTPKPVYAWADLRTVAQAAADKGWTEQQVLAAAHGGRLPCVQPPTIGGMLFRPDDIAAAV